MKEETVNETLDMLPEYCHYQDEGCELANSCLSCHFPQCVYDRPHGRQRLLLKLRDREIARQRGSGQKSAALARKFGVSRRTVTRVWLNACKEGAKRGR